MDNNKNNIEIIKWAFEQGYSLGHNDMKEGIYINFKEVLEYFLQELVEVQTKTNTKTCVNLK
ncbi:MAG: hypothetical protein HRT38_14540 [Alteromonadaceae bacterium]|nr:hypothetical protein [Alteromonadaceae bacterium]